MSPQSAIPSLSPVELAAFRDRLIHVLTDHDRKQSTKKYYNRNALGIYFGRADDICNDIANGAKPREAICAGFTDRLLAAVLRGMALESPSASECKGVGNAWHYVPAAERAG